MEFETWGGREVGEERMSRLKKIIPPLKNNSEYLPREITARDLDSHVIRSSGLRPLQKWIHLYPI